MWMRLPYLFHRWRNWGSERTGDFLAVVMLGLEPLHSNDLSSLRHAVCRVEIHSEAYKALHGLVLPGRHSFTVFRYKMMTFSQETISLKSFLLWLANALEKAVQIPPLLWSTSGTKFLTPSLSPYRPSKCLHCDSESKTTNCKKLQSLLNWTENP